MENACRGAFFGKAGDPGRAILLKTCTPLQIFFKFFCVNFGSTFKIELKEKK